MINYNSPEATALRAAQPDPIVMYLIVRESLNMSIGKTAAQCAHAAQMLQLKFQSCFIEADFKDDENYLGNFGASCLSKAEIALFDEWTNTSFRKVVLVADEKEWKKLKEEFKNSMVLVIDAGLTELQPHTETVIGLLPMKKSQVPKLVKRLQVLK